MNNIDDNTIIAIIKKFSYDITYNDIMRSNYYNDDKILIHINDNIIGIIIDVTGANGVKSYRVGIVPVYGQNDNFIYHIQDNEYNMKFHNKITNNQINTLLNESPFHSFYDTPIYRCQSTATVWLSSITEYLRITYISHNNSYRIDMFRGDLFNGHEYDLYPVDGKLLTRNEYIQYTNSK